MIFLFWFDGKMQYYRERPVTKTHTRERGEKKRTQFTELKSHGTENWVNWDTVNVSEMKIEKEEEIHWHCGKRKVAKRKKKFPRPQNVRWTGAENRDGENVIKRTLSSKSYEIGCVFMAMKYSLLTWNCRAQKLVQHNFLAKTIFDGFIQITRL